MLNYSELRTRYKLLRNNEPIGQAKEMDEDHKKFWHSALIVIGCMLMCLALFIGGCWNSTAHASEYSDEEIVNAIRKAEGTWTYGIKSVACATEIECREICFNTVKNNRKRYKEYGYKRYSSYIEFLQSKYCPTKGRNLSASERRLNRNWLKNVKWFLEHNQQKGT